MASFFNKNVLPSCAWCVFGKPSEHTNEVFCTKRGFTYKNEHCRSYKYDPLKRTPVRSHPADGYNPEDFKL